MPPASQRALWAELIFFVITLMFAYGARTVAPAAMHQAMQSIRQGLESGPSRSLLLSGNPLLMAAGIFVKNGLFLAFGAVAYLLAMSSRALVRALGVLLALGFAAILVVNAVAGGLVVANTSLSLHRTILEVVALGLLPHGVFEIFAYTYIWSWTLWGRRFGRRLRPIMTAFAVLFFAACVEALVTPYFVQTLH